MPDEHLRLPKSPADWDGYHKASGEVLAEGELAEHWLLEQPKSTATPTLASYLYAAGKIGLRDPDAASRFDAWRLAEERAVAATATVAGREIDTFAKIVAAEPRQPMIGDDVLRESVGLLRGLPDYITLGDLPGRRNRSERGAWEIAADTLLQHGINPTDSGFAKELGAARVRVQRNAGELGIVFGAFLRSTELAVAAAYKEKLPSTTWRDSKFRAIAEDLHSALLEWDSTRRSFPDLKETDIRPRAEACHARLIDFARACAPSGEFAQSAAFANVTGLAMTMALGERLAAQITSRADTASVQGLYDRISEVPNREYAQDNTQVYREYSQNFTDLAGTWNEDTDLIKSMMSKNKKNIDQYEDYANTCLGEAFNGQIATGLKAWDLMVNDPGRLTGGQSLDELRQVVNDLVGNLAFLRNYLETTTPAKAGLTDQKALKALADLKERQLARIDAITAQMQRRLGQALKVTQ